MTPSSSSVRALSAVGSSQPGDVKRADARRWYAVQAQPRREPLAASHLERQHFENFCPMRQKARRSGNRHVPALSALFPGYLFVAFDVGRDRWRSINGTIGVMRLVGFGNGGSPAPLPVGFVETLQNWSEAGASSAELQAGDGVRVIGGPFDDLCGVLEIAGEHERVTILLSLLGKNTRVNISRGSLMAA